jgi:uncharacterized OsmC-like protein
MSQAIDLSARLNGFDTEAMGATVSAIKDQPVIAKFQFRARNEWLSGGHNRTTVTDFDGACQKHVHGTPHVIDCDEPQVLLGNDAAVNPAVYALHALAACLCSTLVIHATARGIEIRSVRSTLEGDVDVQGLLGLDPDVRNGFQDIRVGLEVDADAPSETIDELIAIAQAHSPLADIFCNPTPLTVRRVR